MATASDFRPEDCNCLSLRQATRHVTQFYDRFLMPAGLRTTQFSILSKLQRMGPTSINALAEAMVMDRTTLGRNIQPLDRECLIAVRQGRTDRRSKELHVTDKGAALLEDATKARAEAQARFEAIFGGERSSNLRALLRAVTASEFGPMAEGRPDATLEEG
ncbi:MarR family winged helix-turn-helix transcriptional regulator [Microvirga sp. KLBC 81]|uniref:MarR family winged helix-turn-helix transcriptional regulator n=1 Tax=Microvirga sp. KLBC 81 TaxID=1862707 RepID=UPI001402E3D1|nr:MarR family winged helix-turn-helix transcriptional regulator [Microvirga sp. KLBC 81]